MEQFIRKYYPDARDGEDFTRECIGKLVKDHEFDLSKTLLATSVCSDEIIRSATNFRDYLENSHPFTIGGLAGYPFSGITGFKAFASHIPDGGAAIILYGASYWGFKRRYDRYSSKSRPGKILNLLRGVNSICT
jgi:hypothetical protein